MAELMNPHTGAPVEWRAMDDGQLIGNPLNWRSMLTKAGRWDGFTQVTDADIEALKGAGYFDQSRLDAPGPVDPEALARYQATDWQRLRDMGLQMGQSRKDYNVTQYIRDKDGNIVDQQSFYDRGPSMRGRDYATAAAVLGAGALAGYGLAANGIGVGTGTLGTIAPSAATAPVAALPSGAAAGTGSLTVAPVGALPSVGGGVGTMGSIGAGSLGSTALAPVGQAVMTVAPGALPAVAAAPSSVGAGGLMSAAGKAQLARGAMQLAGAAMMPTVKTPQPQGGPTTSSSGRSFAPPTRQPSRQDARVAEMRARYSPANSRVPSASTSPQVIPAPVSAAPQSPPTRVTVPGRPSGMTAQRVISPAQQDIDNYSRAWQA